MTWVEYLLAAAEKSKGNLELWMRHLNKAIQREQILLSEADIDVLTHSERLTSVQRVFLELAVQKETAPWERTVAMSEPAKCVRLKGVLQELSQEMKS